MSQFQDNPYAEPTSTGPAKTSGLAVTALVLSLIGIIPCCGVLAAPIGLILGLIAMVTIGGSPMRKGKGVAVAAILIGLVLTAVQIGGGVWGYGVFIQPVMTGPRDALTAGFAGDVGAFKAAFHGAGATATDAEATAYIGELRRRYGEFASCEMAPAQRSQSTYGQPSAPFSYRLRFDGATVNAEAEMIFADPAQSGFIMKFGYLTVFDEELGDLTYPPTASSQLPVIVPEAPGEPGPGGDS